MLLSLFRSNEQADEQTWSSSDTARIQRLRLGASFTSTPAQAIRLVISQPGHAVEKEPDQLRLPPHPCF